MATILQSPFLGILLMTPLQIIPKATNETLTLVERIDGARRRLTFATAAQIDKALVILFSGFPLKDNGASPSFKKDAYRLALRNLCNDAIVSGVLDIVEARAYPGAEFVPSANQVAAVCRKHHDSMAVDLQRLQGRTEQLTARDDSGPSPEARARMAAKADALVKELAATTAMDKAGVARPASKLFERPKLSEEEFAGVLQRGLARLKREPV